MGAALRRRSTHRSADLLGRVLAWRMQADVHGGLDAATRRMIGNEGPVQLATTTAMRLTRKTRAASCPLTGKIIDGEEQPMRPTFSYGRGARKYRYYVSECLLPTRKATNGGNLASIRLPALRIEKLLATAIGELLPELVGPDVIFAAIAKVVATEKQLAITLDPGSLVSEGYSTETLLARVQQQIDPDGAFANGQLAFTLAIPAGRKGKTVAPAVRRPRHDEDSADIAELVRIAHRKLAELDASPLDPARHATMRAPVDAWTRGRLGIGLIAPDIQKALLQGAMPGEFYLDDLIGMDLPLDWAGQRQILGMTG